MIGKKICISNSHTNLSLIENDNIYCFIALISMELNISEEIMAIIDIDKKERR